MIEAEKLAEVVGADNVCCERAKLDELSQDMSFVNPVRPECIVKPRNTDDIEKIVKHANETLTPLVPVSSGPPHFNGNTVPGVGGAIIVDLSGMKKIMRVYRPERVAMCEPGITFGELIPEVEKEGIRLNIPLLPHKSKSVVGSMLEREPVIMPKYHWDICDPLACVEVIFGNGEMFRTGAAAGPGDVEKQWATDRSQKTPTGPGQISWNRLIQGAQGTMGIITWASMRCELLPQVEKPFWVGSTNLQKIIELTHWLIRLRLVNECFIINNSNLATIASKKLAEEYSSIKFALPTWILFF